ncbi:MAG: ABC transporter ATP-binding protein [[Clostridium] scindens]
MEILRIENVTKTYGEKDTAVHALDRVSFSVEEGRIRGGKQAPFRLRNPPCCIFWAVWSKPDSGTVQVKGTDIFRLNETNQAIFRRRQIGLIYQFYNLIPILTVEENILLPLLLDGKKPNPKRLAADSFSILGLEDRKEHLAADLVGRPAVKRVSVGQSADHASGGHSGG